MIVDTEEEFHPDEVKKIHDDVLNKGLSLIIFADWYNKTVIKTAKFFDENSRQWWSSVTGGANIPALNSLLEPFEIGLGDKVYESEFSIGEHSAYFASGTSIVKFPKSKNNYLVFREMIDQGEDFLASAANKTQLPSLKENAALLGLAQSINPDNIQNSGGRLVVYGDSNCIDSAHLDKDCFWLLSAMLEYAHHNFLYPGFKETTSEVFEMGNQHLLMPTRSYEDENFAKYSKVLKQNGSFVLEKCYQFTAEPEFHSKIKSKKSRPTKK
jgi:membrane-bound transcription factor site-1 protease